MTDYLIVPEKQMNDFIKVAGKYEEKLTYFFPMKSSWRKGHGSGFTAAYLMAWKAPS